MRFFRSLSRTALVFLGVLLVALLVALPAVMAWAHPMPSSQVRLRLREDQIDARLDLPITELKLGWEKPLPSDAVETVQRFGGELPGYIRQHLRPVAPDGRPWVVTIKKITPIAEQTPDVQVDLSMTPPLGAPSDRLTLNYDVIFHKLITHTALVSIESDWRNGVMGGEPVLLGAMDDRNTSLVIDRSGGNGLRGFVSVVRLGMRHIAEGTDHLLFLLVLLLPASLLAQRGKWGDADGVHPSIMRLFKIVSAFTMGHSLTLAAGAVGWLRAPAQPIEVLIALSIFVSAVHALKPLFPGREAFIAAGFGLIHGLAFASVIATFGLDAWHTAQAILGFNIGIEIMQLFVVAASMPWLMLLARTPFYTPFRVMGSLIAGATALGWMGERALGLPNPVGVWVERAATHAVWIVAALAISSVAATAWKRAQRRSGGDGSGDSGRRARPADNRPASKTA